MRTSVEGQTGARPTGGAPRPSWYDVASGMLFLGAAESVHPLAPFIARHTLGAAVEWVGAISAAAYMGFTWNLFLGRLTALAGMLCGVAAGVVELGAWDFPVIGLG